MTWKRLCRISRPRFWFYLLGPFLVGCAAAGLFVPGIERSFISSFFCFYGLFFYFRQLFVWVKIFLIMKRIVIIQKQGYEDLIRPRNARCFSGHFVCAHSAAVILPRAACIRAHSPTAIQRLGSGEGRPFLDTVFNGPISFRSCELRDLTHRVPPDACYRRPVLVYGHACLLSDSDQDADRTARLKRS